MANSIFNWCGILFAIFYVFGAANKKKYLGLILKELSLSSLRYENSKNLNIILKFLFSFIKRVYLKIKNIQFKRTEYVRNFDKYLNLISLLKG